MCQVGSTKLTDDLLPSRTYTLGSPRSESGATGAADEKKPAAEGTVEAWVARPTTRCGWYGQRKGYRGRFGMYLPPLLELLGLAELTHEARQQQHAKPIRAPQRPRPTANKKRSMTMSVTKVVRYRTKPEYADENERLIREVFTELAEKDPGGLITPCSLDYGVSFLHVAVLDGAVNPLTSSPAFARFPGGIGERRAEGPLPADASMVGSYGLLA